MSLVVSAQRHVFCARPRRYCRPLHTVIDGRTTEVLLGVDGVVQSDVLHDCVPVRHILAGVATDGVCRVGRIDLEVLPRLHRHVQRIEPDRLLARPGLRDVNLVIRSLFDVVAVHVDCRVHGVVFCSYLLDDDVRVRTRQPDVDLWFVASVAVDLELGAVVAGRLRFVGDVEVPLLAGGECERGVPLFDRERSWILAGDNRAVDVEVRVRGLPVRDCDPEVAGLPDVDPLEVSGPWICVDGRGHGRSVEGHQ